MEKMVAYIFGSLNNSEVAIKRINRVLIRQYRLNNVLIAGVVCGAMHIVALHSEIKQLNARVEELENVKGEE